MSKVYTKTGDKGQTSLYTGERVDKDCVRVETYGTIDELDSVLGLARSSAKHKAVIDDIYTIQRELWLLMADIASIGKEPNITASHVENLEKIIDKYDEMLNPLNEFLVPGDTFSAATLDLARTVARRAERMMWRLSREASIHDSNVKYLNRLSDLCFTLGRAERELE